MMAGSSRLSAAFVKTISPKSDKPIRKGDGRGGFGLSLLVKPTTTGRVSRTWSQRLRINGKPVSIGLGSYPRVSLVEARRRALVNAQAVEEGRDPRNRESAIPTFSQVIEETIVMLRADWKEGSKTETQWRYLLGEFALPSIGDRRVDAISPADVLAFLRPLASAKPATARKLKAAMSQAFKWAIAHGYATTNPADGNISGALPKLTPKAHHKAIPHNEVAAALRTIKSTEAWPGTKLALEFLVLTASRSGEVRLATWDEVDWPNKTWTVPSSRMKSGRPHRIPLATRALQVLADAWELADGEGSGIVFPSLSLASKPLSDATLGKLLHQSGIGAVPHGFRSTFRDWCAENNVDRQIAEAALAHTLGNSTEAAYLRSDVFDQRRSVMENWAGYCSLA